MNSNLLKLPFFFFFLIILLTSIVMAESGSIPISQYTTKNNYNIPAVGGYAANPNWTAIYIDTTDYNTLDFFRIYSSDFVMSHDSESTSFNIVSGGTNSCNCGSVVMEKSSKNITWYFNTITLTSNKLVLDYGKNIFINLTIGAHTSERLIDNALSVNVPAGIGGDLANQVMRQSGGDIWKYTFSGSVTTSNSYTVGYPSSTSFNISVTKGSITTLDVIHSATKNYSWDTTFNTFPLSYSGVQNDGIYLNISLSGGAYVDTLINSSGCSGCVPVVPPNVIINPTGSGLLWDKSNYSLNDIGTLTYLTSSSFFDYGSTYRIEIYKNNPSTLLKAFDNVGVSGTIQYKFNEVGSYTARFMKWRIFDSILDEKVVTVSLNPSYIFITSPIIAGVAFNASYIFGNVVVNQGELNSVIIEKFTSAGLIPINTISLNNFNIVPGMSYNASLIVTSEGSFKATLFDLSRGKIANVLFDSVNGFIPPTLNITVSYVKSDKSTYLLSDNIIINYGVDNVNYSKYSSKYISIKNTDQNIYNTIAGGLSPQAIQLLSQQSIFRLVIDTSASCGSDISIMCYESTTKNFIAGNNTIELHAKNTTTDIILNTTNIIINKIDSEGYGLSISKNIVCTGEIVQIDTYSPGASSLVIWKVNNLGGVDLIRAYNYTASKSIKFNFAVAGSYNLELDDTNGTTHQTQSIIVKSSCNVAITPIPTSTQPPGQQNIDFVSSTGFLALIFFLVILGICAVYGGVAGVVVGVMASIPILYLAHLIPMWVVFLDAGIVFIGVALIAATQLTKTR